LEYNSKAAVRATEDFKDVFIHGYYKIKELKYILEVDTKTVIELIVGIKTPLNIIFIIL